MLCTVLDAHMQTLYTLVAWAVNLVMTAQQTSRLSRPV